MGVSVLLKFATQKMGVSVLLGVPLFILFYYFFFHDSPLIVSMSPVTSFSFDSEHVPGNFILLW